ncbi:lambda exonuclease family protein [Pandoraea apista]|uniref:lambda exonuclease family protein n=1 Tax=Pandoraea apista TaxID=93218 RepID=UPI002F91E4FE
MIIHRAPQGSAEWHAARAGCITASMFSTARKRVGELTEQQAAFVSSIHNGSSSAEAAKAAGYKAIPRSDIITRALSGEPVGDFSDVAKDYAFRIAVERIGGVPLDDGFENWAMRRGHELEPEARRRHEAKTGVLVEQVGFVTTDDGLFGASADGFIEEDGGAEYKCFVAPDRLRSIILAGDISEVIDQCDGGMWITGRKFWDFCLYCPALEPCGRDLTVIRIERDEGRIEALERDLLAFARMADEFEAALRQQAA